MNGVLLTKGFTLVRRQRMLMVINLDSEPSAAARTELKAHAAIKLAKFVQL